MTKYIAKQDCHVEGQGIIHAGQLFDLDLPEGIAPPPAAVAVPAPKNRRAAQDLIEEILEQGGVDSGTAGQLAQAAATSPAANVL